jgi:hypothetical protein
MISLWRYSRAWEDKDKVDNETVDMSVLQPTRRSPPPGFACPPKDYEKLVSRQEFLLTGIQVAEETRMLHTLQE